MSCHNPKIGYISININPKTGKYPILWNENDLNAGEQLAVRCRYCIDCKIQQSTDDAIRAVHEAASNIHNSFITLTYAPEHLPEHGFLEYDEFRAAIKRLRKRIEPLKIKTLGVGEYGEKFGRPHYHACIFGYDFPDKKPVDKNRNGDLLYESKELLEVWPYGMNRIGNLTYASAAYVARYTTKKVTPKYHQHYRYNKITKDYDRIRTIRADHIEHYQYIVQTTGEVLERPEEKILARSKSLGKEYFLKYYKDWYPQGQLIINHKKKQPPHYYDYLLEKLNPKLLEQTKEARKKYRDNQLEKFGEEELQRRQEVAKKLHKLKFKQLVRNYENAA